MNLPARFPGLSVSEGRASGTVRVVGTDMTVSATADEVAAAFVAVAAERSALAVRLRRAGRDQEADIIEVAALIATDPSLTEPAVAAVQGGENAAAAVSAAAEKQAAVMEGLANRALAERAGDIRQVARAVLDYLGTGGVALPEGDFILVRHEISPADLIELADSGLVGAVSVVGGASSHAAIIARGLGLPMISGTEPAVLKVAPGETGLLDADAGELIIGAVQAARAAPARAETRPVPAGPVLTADGVEITVQCNVASAAETRRGLAAGAAGVGLLRTEIPYIQARAWPTEAEQRAQLAPVLGLLAGLPATVRLLDFSADKIPPFLTSGGLTALLAHPTALADQLAAVLEAGRDTDLSVLIPMVSSLAEVSRVRDVLAETAAAMGCRLPRLGIMVELRVTASAAEEFAAAVDFFSIGTNDLTSDVLGIGRHDPAAGPALAAHPRVLDLIGHVATAGRRAGLPVSVCGDSAADARTLPLLIGAGVRTLSVPAARVPRVRSWLPRLDSAACAELTARAVRVATAEEVWDMVPPL
jgi:phosphoenolpyruvate-protein kinase (PTS system EI component)